MYSEMPAATVAVTASFVRSPWLLDRRILGREHPARKASRNTIHTLQQATSHPAGARRPSGFGVFRAEGVSRPWGSTLLPC